MYTAFYHLSNKPFQLSPDPRFFYASRGHKRAMAYLNYGVSLAEGFIVITGEVGAGKTMLVRNLCAQMVNDNIITGHLVSTQLDADDTLRTVATNFGLEQSGLNKAAVLKNLETFLQQCMHEGKRVLLIIDEAQNLTRSAVEELRMMSNFQFDNKPLLQSFLLGQPEFRNTLQNPEMLQLRQRVIASYHLGPIDETEIGAYIEHRLNQVDWQGDPVFTPEALHRIFEFTGGIPRRINTLCDRIMLLGMLEEEHVFDQIIVDTVIKDIHEEVTHTETAASASLASFESLNPDPHRADNAAVTIALQQLEQKIKKMDTSLNRLLNLLIRKFFFHSPEKHQKALETEKKKTFTLKRFLNLLIKKIFFIRQTN
ncbi:MAG: XrtA/PEP-CTERM system-associated ATPase [Burkholderiales bacterium]